MATATREVSPSHLLFKIKSFSSLDKYEDENYESPDFDSGNYKWRLIIYPNGHGIERAGDNLSVYLAISGTDLLPANWEVHAVFSVFIFNQISGNYHYTTGNTCRFFGLKTEWGVPNFMSKEDLMNPSNGYLIDDCCMFGAEVFVVDSIKAVTRCLSLKDVKVPFKHEIKISDFSKLKDEYWYSEEFTSGGYKWKIKLYPNGDGEEAQRSLSIYLEYVPFNNERSRERVKAHLTTCMKNQLDSNKNYKRTGSRWFVASNIARGRRSFVLLEELNAAGRGFIVNDTLMFEIEISVQAVAK